MFSKLELPVSSMFRAVFYDSETECMVVQYPKNVLYSYYLIPQSVVDELIDLTQDVNVSVGKLFNQLVKKGGFEYKLEEKEATDYFFREYNLVPD